MYSTCLFCSASLGSNETIEAFPVGARVAFDPDRGRLWAVCGRCGRWNLAPIEERWEPVEQAERLFRGTRTRAHSGNIGLARMRDGTRLVRIGNAMPPGEVAAWRYGGQLISRRRRNIAIGTTIGAGAIAITAGALILLGAGIPLTVLNLGLQAYTHFQLYRDRNRILCIVPAQASPTGVALTIRPRHLGDAVLTRSGSGDLALALDPTLAQPGSGTSVTTTTDPLILEGQPARNVLTRAMMMHNSGGASKSDVERAIRAIEDAGGPEGILRLGSESTVRLYHRRYTPPPRAGRYSLRQIAGTFRGEVLPVVKYRNPFERSAHAVIGRTNALALEMALQEEAERKALEGELAALTAAWREAEEIARIADSLPDGPR